MTVNQGKTDAVTLTTLVSGAVLENSWDMISKDNAQQIILLYIPWCLQVQALITKKIQSVMSLVREGGQSKEKYVTNLCVFRYIPLWQGQFRNSCVTSNTKKYPLIQLIHVPKFQAWCLEICQQSGLLSACNFWMIAGVGSSQRQKDILLCLQAWCLEARRQSGLPLSRCQFLHPPPLLRLLLLTPKVL